MKNLSEEILNTIIVKLNQILPGRNIGTSLQLDAEESVNSLLPSGWRYTFDFNMSGEVYQSISYNGNEVYKF